LPICKKIGPLANDVCSGPNNDDTNNNKCCLSTEGVIYKNTVTGSGSTKTCTALTGAAEGIQYFAFDDNHRNIVTLDNINTKTVYSTFKCIVDNKKAVSKCTLVGNQLPTCEHDVDYNGVCFTSGEDDTVCMHSNGSLLIYSGGSCVALIGKAKGIYYFDNDYKKIDPVINLNAIKFIYYCYGGGVSMDAALSDCIPIHSNIGALITGGKGTVPMMRISAFDWESVNIGEASAKYLTLPKYNSFPGADLENELRIEVSTYSKIVQVPTKTISNLPSCSLVNENDNCKNNSGGEVVSYCYDSTFIYENKSDTKCKKVEDTQGSTKYFFFDEGYNKVATPTASPTALKYAYQLKFATASQEQTAEVESFKQITYYQIMDSEKAVYCNGLENEPCVIHTIGKCGNNDIGKLGKVNNVVSVCFGSNKGVALPTDESSKIIAFKPTDYNKYYGESGLTFLKLTKETVTLAVTNESKNGNINKQ